MNIPDEYFTDEVPTEPGFYALRMNSGDCNMAMLAPGFTPNKLHLLNARYCRLDPAAENHKLRELVNALRSDVATFCEMGARLKAENEKLRGWVRDAYEEGRDHQSAALAGDDATFENSMAKVRLERRSE